MQWVEGLFNTMLMTYGKRFSDMWDGVSASDMKRFWVEKFVQAGLSISELEKGKAMLDTKTWPPTLTEFINLCRPPANPTAAYYEALYGMEKRSVGEMGNWTHPAIFWAASRMSNDLLSVSYSNIKPRWEKALADEMEKGSWEPVPQPARALEAPKPNQMPKEEAKKNIETIKQMLQGVVT